MSINRLPSQSGWISRSWKGIRLALSVFCCVLILGCSSASKKTEPKELAKLSLDAQEEAQKLRDQGNLQAAAAKYQESLRYRPSPSAHFELGGLLEKQGKYDEARSQYELALAKNPDMPEADEALDRLAAREELGSPVPDKGPAVAASQRSKSASSESSQEPVPTPAPTQPAVVLTPEEKDIFDEDRKFLEMSELQPPKEDSDIARRGSPPEEHYSDPDNEYFPEEQDELTGFGRGSEPVRTTPGEELLQPTQPKVSTTKSSRPQRTQDLSPVKEKTLRGGRGLLNSLEHPPEIHLASSREDEFNGIPPANWMEAQVFTAVDPYSEMAEALQVARSGRPGERGLGGGRKLPKEAPLPPAGKAQARSVPAAPENFTLEDRSKAPRPTAVPKAQPSTPPEEKKGFWARTFGPEEITYPDPPTPEAEKALPSPYGTGREELDVRPFHMDRLKGKRKVEFDVQVCKDRYYKEKDLEGAVRCFNDKKIDFPENALIYYELGLVLEDAGNYPLARKNMELAVRYDPTNEEYKKTLARLDVGRARSLRVDGNYAAALSILRRTIERYPDMVEAHRELGRVYATDAMAKERGLEEGTPSSADLAAIIKRTWNYAEQAYQEVVALSDGDYKDWYNLGVAIQKQNQDEKRTSAIKAYERSITLNPDYPNAHYHLGILYESSNVSKAQEHYEIALRQARQMPKEEGQDLVMRCLASLGELNWRIGNKEKAAEYLTEYIQFAPGDAYIEQMLNQITSEPIGASE